MTKPGSSLLIIDDDPIHLETMATTLRLKFPQANVETMESAVGSLERIRSRSFEAVLCDGQQSGLEGPAFVRAVRKLQQHTPVVLFLEKDDEDATRQAMEAGAYDVLIRPIAPQRLVHAMQRAIETHRLRVEVQREREELLTTLGCLLKDLESLYGADGLSVHFAAFLEQAEQHKRDPGKNHGSNGEKLNGQR